MRRQDRIRNPRTFVVARQHDHGHTTLGDVAQWREGALDERRRDPAPVEEVTAVDHEIDLAVASRRERPLVAGEEVRPPSPASDPWAYWLVEAQMGVREEENACARHDQPHD